MNKREKMTENIKEWRQMEQEWSIGKKKEKGKRIKDSENEWMKERQKIKTNEGEKERQKIVKQEKFKTNKKM